ncbi:hypothetical protein AGOR_G00235210 [Albula goreensis]|uniref:Caspase recruitment domain-containing protein n=1 Tax=Albula goreensis TaxID=1534307 RepID=A0A8T3CIH8_9TELE|nr:hypothetical protein AGOR_G00235210 [Albula goreensis]
MPFAEDKLYQDFVRPEMPQFVEKVKPLDLSPYLVCLTDSDKEQIRMETNNRGNRAGVEMLIDNLKRRENWPEHLIQALEKCGYPSLASQTKAAYQKLLNPKAVTKSPAMEGTPLLASSPHARAPSPFQATSADRTPPAAYEPPFSTHYSSHSSNLWEDTTLPTSSAAVLPPSPQGLPEKTPIQDTHSPEVWTKLVPQQYPIINQAGLLEENRRVPGSSPWSPPRSQSGASSQVEPSGHQAPFRSQQGTDAEMEDYFSKPGVLRHLPPASETQAANWEEPFSNNVSLQISGSSASSSSRGPDSSAPDVRESFSGVPGESRTPSFGSGGSSHDVRENVIRFRESPAIPNQGGQDPHASNEPPGGTLSKTHNLPVSGSSPNQSIPQQAGLGMAHLLLAAVLGAFLSVLLMQFLNSRGS